MGLLTFILIPCHHVLASEISLNLKYHIGLKEFFNLNLGIGIIKKLLLYIFSTYLPVFLLKFRLGELIGCEIKFRIQRVPTRHNFEGPYNPKNKKYIKKRDDDFQHISSCFYLNFNWEISLDAELNFASNKYPLDILLMDPTTPKTRNTWKNVMMSSSHFSRYFLFLG